MKKIFVLVVFVILFFNFFGFVRADNLSNLSGKINIETIESNARSFNIVAQEKFEGVNQYAGFISKILFGVEISYSWIFFLSFFFWLVLLFVIGPIISSILKKGAGVGYFAGAIIASLSLHSFMDNFVAWIDSIAIIWYSVPLAIVSATIIAVVIRIFFRRLYNESKIEKAEKVGRILNIAAKVEEEKFKSYKDNKKK